MGAYSELDIELQYGNSPFEEGGDAPEQNTSAFVAAPLVETPAAASTKNHTEQEPAQTAQTAHLPQAGDQPPAQVAESTADSAAETDEDAKRKAHEKAEAERKAEWKAAKKRKKEAEKLLIAQIENMSNDEVTAASMKRVSEDTEKLTRRHMMECVAEYIQTKCIEDPDFARKTMHPKKTMIRCYQYINRKAWEFVQDELKARGITPSRTEPYASSIPEDVCYQWAVDYFNTSDVQEDVEKEEKFVPKPYRSTTAATTKSTASKGGTPDKAEGEKNMAAKETKPATPKKKDDDGQISFGGFAMPEAKAV